MVKVIEDITPVLLDRLQQGTINMALVALPVPGNTHSCLPLLAISKPAPNNHC
jgi:hypothetical protein